MSDVEALRAQLRERGYLTHGIERWFALDPWSSRTFWLELVTVALKAAVLIAAFGSLAMTAIMAFRNHPLGALETGGVFVAYFATWLIVSFGFVVLAALILKVRPALPIDTPRALLAISFVAAALLVAPVALWWYGFDAAPPLPELVVGAALCVIFFLVAMVVVSAALLSFSIYEMQRVPAIHQKRRGVPMLIGATLLIAMLFVPAYSDRDPGLPAPMIVTEPSANRVVLVAVDGMTAEIFRSRPDLARLLPVSSPIAPVPGASTTERWASVGTGVPTEQHGVRAIEGVRLRGGTHVLQRISSGDFVLMHLAPLARIARREPLPPTVRRRDYVWEIFADRGVPSVAVNWWATGDARRGGLTAVGPESIFADAQGQPLRLDALAASRFLEIVDREKPQFATVYLPALDVILNRLELDRSAQLASSLRTLDGIANLVSLLRARGYDIVLTGMPGEGQTGAAVLAATVPLRNAKSEWDVAPTLLDLLGFPLSSEMPGNAHAGNTSQPRIATYGNRTDATEPAALNQEYYDNLRSLGYIR